MAALTAYQQKVLADGAVAYWPLDDAVGSPTARELVGAVTGVVNGSVLFGVPGPGSSTAAQFFAAAFDAYILAPLTTLPQVATVEGWIRWTGTGSPLMWFSNQWGTDAPVVIDVRTGNAVYGLANNRVVSNAGAPLPAGVWTSVVLSIDAVGGLLQLYVNGLKNNELSGLTRPADSHQTAISLGGNDDGVYNWWNGELADIAIYPRLLSPGEILAHHALQTASGGGQVSWATIDSAPKDGRDILAVRLPQGRQLVLHWSANVPPAGAWVGEEPTRPVHPTHWAALPTPPATPGPGGGELYGAPIFEET